MAALGLGQDGLSESIARPPSRQQHDEIVDPDRSASIDISQHIGAVPCCKEPLEIVLVDAAVGLTADVAIASGATRDQSIALAIDIVAVDVDRAVLAHDSA